MTLDDRTMAFSERPPDDDSFPSIPGYRVTGRLGEGGMGAVYLAEETSLGRQVAVKVVSERVARNAEIRTRFLREARLLATVEHPNVVRVYTFGTSGDRAYLVMEYVEGETLADRIRRDGPMSVDAALQIVREVCGALEVAWEKRVIHRDIKPSNILFDRRGNLRVADFGLAKGIESTDKDSSLTQTGYLLGSPHYVAPEQVQGRDSDFRADIYSLGVMLFEMLTATRPFDAPTPIAVVAKHLHDRMPDVHTLRPDVPDFVSDLLTWMTAKDPDARPQSYGELLAAIRPSADPTLRATLKVPRKSRSGRRAAISLAILALLVLGFAWLILRHSAAARPETVTASIDNRLTIAVAPFYGPDSDSMKEGRVMAAMIERDVTAKLGSSVRVLGIEETGKPIRDHDGARAVGERLGASIVVWGDAFTLRDETEIQPSVTVIPRKRSATETPGTARVSGGDVSADLALQSTATPVRVESGTQNQIQLRRTSAEGVGDLVSYIAATYVLHEENDPRRALDLLAQTRETADAHYQRAICYDNMNREPEALGELQKALALDPKHAAAHALHGDIDARASRWADAITHHRAAVAQRPEITTTEAIFFDGKLYVRERWRQKTELRQTATMLAYDPASLRVIERHRLPGIPTSFSIEHGSTLVIRYTPAPQAAVAATVRFSGGKFDPPVQSFGNLLMRMQTMKAGWRIGAPFMSDVSVLSPNAGAPRFRYNAADAEPDSPKTLEELVVALEAAIAHDPTQPWYLFHLGLAQWELGERAKAEATWTKMFAEPFPGVAYYDYAWIARQFAPFGHRKWADLAVAEAIERRKALPQPIAGTTLIERLINAPFVRQAALESRSKPDPVRHHQILTRTRELTGLVGEGEDLAAAAWASYFEKNGNLEMAARERTVAALAGALPSNYARYTGWVDVAGAARNACLVTLLIGVAWLFWRARRSKAANVWSSITMRDRLALVGLAVAALVFSTMQVIAMARTNLGGLPIGVSDGIGDARVVKELEELLIEHPTKEMKFIAATAHHMAGNRKRASELYRGLDANNAVQNAAVLNRNVPPPHIPGLEDIARELARVRMRDLQRELQRPLRVWFGGAYQPATDTVDAIYIAGATWWWVAVLVVLLVALAAYAAPVAHGAVRTRVRPLLAVAAISFVAFALIGRASSTRPGQIATSGAFASHITPSLENVFPYPPAPNATAAYASSRAESVVMRVFWTSIVIAVMLAIAGALPPVSVVRCWVLRLRDRQPASR